MPALPQVPPAPVYVTQDLGTNTFSPVTSLPDCPVSASSKADEALLLGFKASLSNGDQILTSWQNGTDYCAWKGIKCNAGGRVKLL